MTTRKTIALTLWTFVSKVMSLLFSMQSRFVIAFLPRRMHLLISWLQSPTAVTLKPKKIKSVAVSNFPPSFCHEMMELDAKILVFWMLSSSQLFYSPLLPSSRGSLVPLHFLPSECYHLHTWGCWYFSWHSCWYLWLMQPGIWHNVWASLVAQTVRNLPTMWKTWVWLLDWEDPLEKGMATHSSILAWGIPWTV